MKEMKWTKAPAVSIYSTKEYTIRKEYDSWACYYHKGGHIGTRKQDIIGYERTLKAAKERCAKHAEEQ